MRNEEPGYPRVEIAFNKQKILLLILYNLLILAVCVYVILSAGSFAFIFEWILRLMAIAGFFFFGSSVVLFAMKLGEKGPGFILDNEGFIDHADAVSAGRIYWEEVTGISQWHFAGQAIIQVKVQDPAIILKNQSLFKRLLMHFNIRRFGTPVTVTSGALEMDSDNLFRLLKDYITHTHGEPDQQQD